MSKEEQFDNLIKELKRCGYLEDEIFAIARIGTKEPDKMSKETLDRGIDILNRQLNFAKRCINVVGTKKC
jgi:hypothetical protein